MLRWHDLSTEGQWAAFLLACVIVGLVLFTLK